MKLQFPVKSAKFLKTPVFIELLWWLFLKIKEGLREVPALKIVFLKELKFVDLCRLFLKTDRSIVMILWFYFSFIYIEDCMIYKIGDN